jgi:type IX secretion system PorP/SprF family membrane protein
MKRILLILVCAFFVLVGRGQQRPHYTQYILNNYILNPALSGIENYTDVKLSARDQWVGLNGAPKTCYFSIQGPIGKKDYKTTATSYEVPGENPRGKNYWQDYTASDPHHGVGLSVISDKTGLYQHFTADISYAYHIGISPRTNIAVGFSGGFSEISYDRSKATPVDLNDPALGGDNENIHRIVPDLNTGIWLYSADYFLGVSAQQVIPEKVDFGNENIGFKLIPHYFATAGYRFLLNDDVNALPSVMVKYIPDATTKTQFDINVKLQYQDKLWTGGSYRLGDGYAAMVGININNFFNVGYSYDLTKTKLNTVSRGTHEIVLGFILGNRYDDSCPRNVW